MTSITEIKQSGKGIEILLFWPDKDWFYNEKFVDQD